MDQESLASSLARFVDEREIRDVLASNFRGMDQGDLRAVRGCLHPDAVKEVRDIGWSTDELAEHASVDRSCDSTKQHFIGNIRIELEGDQALTETYCLIVHRKRLVDGTEEIIVGARYPHRPEKGSGGWKVAHPTPSPVLGNVNNEVLNSRPFKIGATEVAAPPDVSRMIFS
jgi:hypothetical protein